MSIKNIHGHMREKHWNNSMWCPYWTVNTNIYMPQLSSFGVFYVKVTCSKISFWLSLLSHTRCILPSKFMYVNVRKIYEFYEFRFLCVCVSSVNIWFSALCCLMIEYRKEGFSWQQKKTYSTKSEKQSKKLNEQEKTLSSLVSTNIRLLMFRLLFILHRLHPFASTAIKDCFRSDFLCMNIEVHTRIWWMNREKISIFILR